MIRGPLPVLAAAALSLALAGCTNDRKGPVSQHYMDFTTEAPRNNTVHHCSSYGCRTQTKFTFTKADLEAIRALMKKTMKADTAQEERRAVAYAYAWMDVRVGKVTGTINDRPGDDFSGGGDPEQMDCVDTATNGTNYLLVLQNNNLLKHHTVGTPFSKEDWSRGLQGWPHWTAVLKESTNGQRWAVDSWMFKVGENPAVVEAEKWYIDDDTANHTKSMR